MRKVDHADPFPSEVQRPIFVAVSSIDWFSRLRQAMLGRPALFGRPSRLPKLLWVPRSAELLSTSRIVVDGKLRILKGVTIDARHGSISIATDVVICRFAVVEAAGGEISIGARTVIGDYCTLYGQGGLRIGADVLIASGVRLVPSTHVVAALSAPTNVQGIVGRGVLVEDNVWIGTNAVILDGVTIGEGSIVGAGSVVTRNVPRNGVVAGVPARFLRFRT